MSENEQHEHCILLGVVIRGSDPPELVEKAILEFATVSVRCGQQQGTQFRQGQGQFRQILNPCASIAQDITTDCHACQLAWVEDGRLRFAWRVCFFGSSAFDQF